MNVLFVVAHPDDEALGAGATIHRLVQEGHNVYCCVMNTFDKTVYHDNAKHRELLKESHDYLGIKKTYYGSFDDSNMQNADHRGMVQFVESAIRDCKPTIIFTQHPSDVNSDHFWTFQSVVEAFRLGQRQRVDVVSDVPPVAAVYLMEVLSSTDWGVDPSKRSFSPNTFFEVSELDLKRKVLSMSGYEGVLRDPPHPRRSDTIFGLASLRGAQAGYRYAEAFECVFRRSIL